jgi:hypothetical protein
MIELFLAVVVTTMILFSSPATAADLNGTRWQTSYGEMQFTQSGNSVTGSYTRENGKLTGTLEGQLLKAWWWETDNDKECGPENAWSGPILFRFANDWMSFDGDWAYCPWSPDDLNPDERRWNGALIPETSTTTTEQTTSTTTVPAISTTTVNLSTTTTLSELGCGPNRWECSGKNDGWCCEDEDDCFRDPEDLEDYCISKDTPECLAGILYESNSGEVKMLRRFRDGVLTQSPEGRELIRLYYEWSPVIVKAMEEDEEFKKEVREMVDGVLELIGGGE